MRKILAATMAASAISCAGTVPATASASYLYKSEARSEAKHFVKERVNQRKWSWATWWWVEPATKCSRRTSSVVECDFQLVDEEDVDEDGTYYGCEDTVRIRETPRYYYATYPFNADCDYGWTD